MYSPIFSKRVLKEALQEPETMGSFISLYFKSNVFENFGEPDYLDFGGAQIKFNKSLSNPYAEIYYLITPKSGYNGWMLEYSKVTFRELINYNPSMLISEVVFNDSIKQLVSFVGSSLSIEKFYVTKNSDSLYEIIIDLLSGIIPYGKGTTVAAWEISEAESIKETQNKVLYHLKSLKLSL